ncbi:glycosyltransferase [Marinobacter sp.]|uniref:glycosyltransferase n=1 Tax=Marinobacter sp. TaxID=50741 RepID=UPI0035C74B5D
MIVINAVSAVEGGALTVLSEFIESLSECAVCFCAVSPDELPDRENVEYIFVGHQKSISRLTWDCYRFNQALTSINIRPHVVYSLNNMAPILKNYKSVQQIVFFHQAIPFSNFSASLFSSSFSMIFFYKRVYPLLVRAYDRENVNYRVQARWIKDSLSTLCGISQSRITVERPRLGLSNVVPETPSWVHDVDFVYPASDFEYKNHLLLIAAAENLLRSEFPIRNRPVIALTLGEESWVFGLVKRKGVRDFFRFVGPQPRASVLGAFASGCGLVFPSVVETVGLPLLEASHFGAKILVSDLAFSRETLAGREEGCLFLNPEKPEEWALKLSEFS